MKKVIVIGGGFAGLAASAELVSSGNSVTLVEQRRYLGGRAYSFHDRNIDIELDNGQHLLMGCYENTFRFLNTIGTTDRLYIQDNLHVDFLETNGHAYKFDCLPLPPPFHAASGILRFNALKLSERIRMLNVVREMLFDTADPEKDCAVSEWFERLGQGKESRDRFWNVLTYAAMNEGPDAASASLFKAVLKKAFFKSRRGSRLIFPAVPLSRLYVDDAEDYIRRQGGVIEKGCLVTEILIENDAVSGIRLRDGRVLTGDDYIAAVPYYSLQRLLSEEIMEKHRSCFRRIRDLAPSPILSIHLLFDRSITDYPFAAFIDSPIQWFFNKEKIYRDNAYRGLFSLVISGAHLHVEWDKERLLEMALTEIGKVFPESSSAKLLYGKIIRERFATFSPRPGIQRHRPDQKTPVKNLFLAGDWTDTGLPATIESAVTSGYRCAEMIKGTLPTFR